MTVHRSARTHGPLSSTCSKAADADGWQHASSTQARSRATSSCASALNANSAAGGALFVLSYPLTLWEEDGG